MAETTQSSRFALNLITQLFLGTALTAMASLWPTPVNIIFGTIAALLNWSFMIGLLYSVIRMMGTKIDRLEWYYQHVPFGFPFNSVGGTASTQAPTADRSRPAETLSTPVNWERFFSVEYIRYAGLILIISAVFAFLFRIEWSLPYKIAASFLASFAAIVAAEVGRTKNRERLAGSCFLVSFAFAQFGLTLLFKYFLQESGPQHASLFAELNFWLAVKFGLTLICVFLLRRYPASFVPLVFFIIVYLSPVSLLRVIPVLPTSSGLLFVLATTVLALTYAVHNLRYEVQLLNAVFANLYAFSFINAVNRAWVTLSPFPVGQDTGAIEQNIQIFMCLACVFLLHLAAGAMHVARLEGEDEDIAEKNLSLPVSELVVYHVLGMSCLIGAQANIPQYNGYYGLTFIVTASLSFFVFLLLRNRKIDNSYTEVLFNAALLLSVVGMFLNTEGTWTAIVFLLFSCLAIYLSFVLGTFRTRVYAFAALTVSMFKLYVECSDLFDSIPGTAMILVIGVILMVLSYKLEGIKSLVASRSDPK